MALNNVPDAGKGWASNSETPAPFETNHSVPLADEPLEAVPDDVRLHTEKPTVHEAVEEAETPSDEDDYKKELQKRTIRRARSNFTATTGTSYASTEIALPPEEPPRKRKWTDRWNPLKDEVPPPVPAARPPSRETQAGILSLLTFQWMAPLMNVGYQRPLELNDIWAVNPRRSVDAMKTKLLASLEKRKAAGSRNPIAMALYDTYKTEFLIGGFCQLTAACLQVLSPFTMKYLIVFAADAYYGRLGEEPEPSIGRGIGLVFAIYIMQSIQSLSTNHFIYRGMLVGGQARSALIAVIFEKSMKLSGRARAGGTSPEMEERTPDLAPGSKEEKAWLKAQLKKQQNDKTKPGADRQGWGNGRIVNLMSVDTYRVDLASGMFHMCWTSPIQIVLTLALLCVNLTYSALAGFAFICCMMPLLAFAIKSLMRRRKAINKITDQRVSLTQEIISSVRFVKFFGWETSFLDRLAEIRVREISRIAFLLSIRNGIMAVSMSIPIFASMLAFITYSLTHRAALLDPAPVFSSLALFNSMRIPLNMLPMVLGQVVDAIQSLGRIQQFLDLEEIRDDATWDEQADKAIDIRDGGFTWERTRSSPDQDPADGSMDKQAKKDFKNQAKADKRQLKLSEKAAAVQAVPSTPDTSGSSMTDEETPFHIREINLSVGRNELIAIIGSVGSGKSSLLAALAGDMRKTSGHVTFGASRAFCPQYAWIQNTTVKENILFGREYDRKWYNKVIDACALRPDLEMLPAGDQTEIGERGITVSGGQKQRLNIARAIYFDADIVLMDDPLSAVDAHVGKHIMDKAICGLMKHKARVLATHQLHVLHRVDRIVWMKEGTIHKTATFDDLMANDVEFQKLMETTASEDKKEGQVHANDDEIEEEKKTAQKTKKRKAPIALMQQEDKSTGSVGGAVYLAYMKATGSIIIAPLTLFLLVASQGANIMTNLWLSFWTDGRFDLTLGDYIGTYAALGVVQAGVMFSFTVTLTYFGTKASKTMLNRAVFRVLRAPMSFFDTTPLGRITNRFSKDVDTMDNVLTDSIRMFFMTMCMILSVFVLIIAYYYYFVVALVPLTLMFLFSASYYRSSARELKRHEALLRSVMFARFGEAVSGISTIRAYGVQKQFGAYLEDSIDSMDGAYFLTYANQRWLSTRLDALGNLLVFTCGILVVTARFNVSPSTGGLILSYILSIAQMIQFTVRQLAEMENNMNSTERIHYYGTQLDEEAPLHLGEVRPSWPEKGEIVFDNVQMRYRAGLPLVLKGLTMRVQAGERIGVVGRTGAGKSSIMSTLFRLTELSGGSISIDGVDISRIGLKDLRSRLAIIPQDPTLFKGTIRSNLDPFHEHNDLDLWNALRQADLVGSEQTMDDDVGRIHLDTPVDDEGLNFSLGQRQMLALARALVRGSQIIVCDEATSSVDFETDQKIQRTIVRGFRGKTLLCIAHRLKTIIGYDRILVMDAGNVAELDRPIDLYDRGGIFRSMCDRSGIRREDFFASEEARFAAEESPQLERTQSAVMPKEG